MPKRTLTTGSVARRLRVAESALQNLIRTGKVPAPSVGTGRRRWTEADVARARKALKKVVA